MTHQTTAVGRRSIRRRQSWRRATRFALICFVLFATAENIALCGRIEMAGKTFGDMLGAAPALPAITVWVLRFSGVIKVLSFVLPLIALGLLFVRRAVFSIYAAGVLLLFTLTMSAVVRHALWSPLFEIIRRMQGGAPSPV